jgi:hypothetical protein
MAFSLETAASMIKNVIVNSTGFKITEEQISESRIKLIMMAKNIEIGSVAVEMVHNVVRVVAPTGVILIHELDPLKESIAETVSVINESNRR